MDLVLLQGYDMIRTEFLSNSFNPYFNGSSTSTISLTTIVWGYNLRFNPYFNGSSTST